MPNITIYASAEDHAIWIEAKRLIPGVSKKLMTMLRRELPALIDEEKKKFEIKD